MDFFFYGTLMDPAVRRLVLGRIMERGDLLPATLSGYRRQVLFGTTEPVLVRRPGGVVPGLLCRALDRADAARLDAFEGDDYSRGVLPVRLSDGVTVRAYVYLMARRARADGPWRFDQWQRRYKRGCLRRWSREILRPGWPAGAVDSVGAVTR